MLRIYKTAIEMTADVEALVRTIKLKNPDLARQISRASHSVVLNIAEGSGFRDGRRRMRYADALGSAYETRAGLEAALEIRYTR